MPELPTEPVARRYFRDYLRRGGHLVLDLTADAAKDAREFEGAIGFVRDPLPQDQAPLGAVLEVKPALALGRYHIHIHRQDELRDGHIYAHARLLEPKVDGVAELGILILGRTAKGPADPLDFSYID